MGQAEFWNLNDTGIKDTEPSGMYAREGTSSTNIVRTNQVPLEIKINITQKTQDGVWGIRWWVKRK